MNLFFLSIIANIRTFIQDRSTHFPIYHPALSNIVASYICVYCTYTHEEKKPNDTRHPPYYTSHAHKSKHRSRIPTAVRQYVYLGVFTVAQAHIFFFFRLRKKEEEKTLGCDNDTPRVCVCIRTPHDEIQTRCLIYGRFVYQPPRFNTHSNSYLAWRRVARFSACTKMSECDACAFGGNVC